MKKEIFSQILDQVAKEWLIDTKGDPRGRPTKEENEEGPNLTGYPIVLSMKPCIDICFACNTAVEDPHWQHSYDPVRETWSHKCLNCKLILTDKAYRKKINNK